MIKKFIAWAIAGIALVCCVATIYSFMAYRDVANKIVASEEFTDLEDYGRAITILESAKASWVVKSFGAKREIIDELSSAVATREVDRTHLEDGIDFGIDDLSDGISKLSEIARDSHYFDQAQIKIGEFRIQLLERDLNTANDKKRIAEEEIERLLISNKALETTLSEETESKIEAESAATLANKRADQEAAAKRSAQQQAAEQEEIAQEEAAAKRLAQQQAAAQAALAGQREKDRILVLANTHPMIQAVVSGELKFYFEPLPGYAATGVSAGVEEIARSLSEWDSYNATMRRVYSASDADLVVAWVKDYGTHVLGESIYKSHIKVGLGTENCQSDWMAFDPNTVKKVLWHEIGHSMGYSHSPDLTNVMYYLTSTHFYVEQDISESIASGWYMTFPLCGLGEYWYSFESDSTYEGFDIYVLPPGADAAAVYSGDGLVYADCGAAGIANYRNSCNVDYGASIYISPTHYYNGVTVTGEVIALDEPVWPVMTWDESVFEYEDSDLLYYHDLFR